MAGGLMRILGLTGSIGMGKSTTAKLFAEAGVPVYDADAAVHQLYEGEAVPCDRGGLSRHHRLNGKVDRPRLSARVVHDPAAMQAARADRASDARCLPPEILCRCRSRRAPVVVVDMPLLFETGGEKRVDAVVVVTTSPENCSASACWPAAP